MMIIDLQTDLKGYAGFFWLCLSERKLSPRLLVLVILESLRQHATGAK